MDKATKNTTNLYDKKCAVEFGRGGRRACGVYPWCGDEGNARYLTQGVSGARYRSFDNELLDAYTWLNFMVPEIANAESARKYHMTIPHTKTNLSRTYNDSEGEIFHIKGAIAYTFCEMDDESMLTTRMAATCLVTKSYDRQIDKREYLYKTAESSPVDLSESPEGATANDTNNETDKDDEGIPTSQEFHPSSYSEPPPTKMDVETTTPQKKCKLSEPAAAA
jgi:hypothetical protein